MMIDPGDMLLFAAVVREGGFTAAARALGITKQSVSERVAGLERALGVKLVARTTRTVRPTDAGAAYYARVSAIAALIEEAHREVQQGQAEPTGLLRISAPVLYGRRFLGGVVTDFLRKNPRLRCELVLGDQYVNLVEEGFDLAIRVGDLDDSSLVARTIGTARVQYVASPAYLREHGEPRTGDALAEARCIAIRAGEAWEMGGRRVKIEPVLVVNDLEAACDAAVRGLGIARVTSLVSAEAMRRGRLRAVLDDAPPMRRKVHVLHPSGPYLPAKVRLFVEALLASAPGLDPAEPRSSAGARPPSRRAQRPRRDG